MTCSICGAVTVIDLRSKRTVCSTCGRGPAVCTCKPIAFMPTWLQRGRDGLNRGKILGAAA